MEFGYSKEQVLLRDLYKKFAETEVKPLAEELDEEERFPVETVKKLARYGFLGIPFPKEYGGAGGSYLTYSMAVEELAKVCGTTAIIVSAPHPCVQAPSTCLVQKNRNRNTWYPWQKVKNWVLSV